MLFFLIVSSKIAYLVDDRAKLLKDEPVSLIRRKHALVDSTTEQRFSNGPIIARPARL